MSKNHHRRKKGVHIGARQRKKIRQQLVEAFGDKCCWCGEPMEIPEAGKDIKNMDDLATIEHHFAVEMGEPDNIMLFRLAHARCNK